MAVLLSDGQKSLEHALQHILDTFLTDEDYARGIFIKPNIVFAVRPESGEITPPLFVKILISVLRERYSNIDIVLGEGVAAGCDPSENFQVSGYAELARELSVPLLDLHCAERKTIAWKFGRLQLPSIAWERTYINLPILKPSSACVISGALKNQKGLVPPEMKKHFHRLGLHEQLAELNTVVQPALTIMDCSRFFGRNVLISGNNCGEIDATACELLGLEEPDHVHLSRSARVFTSGYSVQGDKINRKPVAKRLATREFKRLARLRLWSNPQACTMCRYLFHDVQKDFLKRQDLLARIRLLAYSLKGAEIIMGLNAQWRKEYPTVICVGNCTRPVARKGEYIHIPGCPPTASDFYNSLSQSGKSKENEQTGKNREPGGAVMHDKHQNILMEPSDPRWMDFIASRPDANIFHHPAWLKLMHECYGYSASILAILGEHGNIRAGMPFMDVNSFLTGHRWVSLPFSDYCNPLYQDEAALGELTNQLVHNFQSKNLKKIEVRWHLPEQREIQQVSEFVLHTIQLDPDSAQVSRHFKRTHLQNIRTAEERGVKVEFGNQLTHLKAFYDLQLETRKRHGVPAQPWKYFELLWQHIVKPGMGFVLLATKDDEYIAGMVYLGWGRTLIAKYAASREDRFNLRPNNLLFWEGIRWGCQNGFSVFDMGRTEVQNTGLRTFKSRWGALEEPLYYSILSSKPLQAAHERVDRVLHSVIQHSPLWVCRLSGELLYRHVG